jgi:hypothetical protein
MDAWEGLLFTRAVSSPQWSQPYWPDEMTHLIVVPLLA